MNAVTEKNEKMITAKAASARFDYSPDYITRLAREGKIIAEQIGRQWHVDIDSLKLFTLQVEADKRARQEELRAERKQELAKTQKQIVITKQETALATVRPMALALTAVAALCLMVMGSVSFVAYEEKVDAQAMLFGADDVASRLFDTLFAPWKKTSTSEAEVQSGVVLLPTSTPAERLEEVRDSFSDEVRVELDGSDTGVVTPVFKESEGESYRFLLVPVAESNTKNDI